MHCVMPGHFLRLKDGVRAADESRGLIRWLRPEYQNLQGGHQTGLNIANSKEDVSSTVSELSEWPKTLSQQAKAINRIIQQSQHPV